MIETILHDKDVADGLADIHGRVRNPAGLLKVVGRRGANELKSHFRRRNATPNKLGGRRSNFWRQVADSVNSPVLEGTSRVRISIGDPRFPQKVYGGVIRPKKAGALTIPVDALAYDRTVATFQQETGIQLFLLRRTGGGISNLLAGIVGEKKVTVFYVLMKSVDQAKDPEALPPRDKFGKALLSEAGLYLAREVIRSNRDPLAP